MIKKTIYLLFTFSFLLSIITPAAFSYQFRDYTWGMPQNVVKERLVEEGREITEKQNVLHYKDKLFNIDCRVVFLFTLTGHLLCGICLIWNNTEIGTKLKEELTKKYGEPAKPNAYIEEYSWSGSSEYDTLNLDYNYGDARLEYSGGNYFKEYQVELTNLFAAKNGYGPDKPPRQPHIIIELDGGRR